MPEEDILSYLWLLCIVALAFIQIAVSLINIRIRIISFHTPVLVPRLQTCQTRLIKLTIQT